MWIQQCNRVQKDICHKCKFKAVSGMIKIDIFLNQEYDIRIVQFDKVIYLPDNISWWHEMVICFGKWAQVKMTNISHVRYIIIGHAPSMSCQGTAPMKMSYLPSFKHCQVGMSKARIHLIIMQVIPMVSHHPYALPRIWSTKFYDEFF